VPGKRSFPYLTKHYVYSNVNDVRETKKPATIKDLAENTGLSIATVSRVLNNSSYPIPISERTRKKVYAAARDIHYRPNLTARNLRKKRKTLYLGILLPTGADITHDAFIWTLISNLQKHRSNESIQLSLLSYLPGHINIFWEKTDLLSFSGIFVCIPADEDVLFIDSKQEETLIPWLFIHRTAQHCPYVTCDEKSAATTLVHHFFDAGHQSILFFNTRDDSVGRERKSAIQKECAKTGALFQEIIAKDTEEGYRKASALISQSHTLPTGWITNGYNTLGILHALREKKIRIPEDISLAAFNNLTGWPLLTSMEEPTAKMGARAIQMMEEIIQGKKNLSKEETIPSFFHRGKTVGSPLLLHSNNRKKRG
jgi:LacI family transcriptional regulator